MSGRTTLAAILSLAGGLAAAVGSFMVWAEVSAGPFSERAKGIDGWEGKLSLIAGLVMITAAVRALRGRDPLGLRLRSRAAFAGLVAAGVGTYTALTAERQLLDAAATAMSRAEAERALESGLLELSIGAGLYVAIAGGVQGIVAALVTLGVGPAPSAPSRSGLRGWSDPPDGAPPQ